VPHLSPRTEGTETLAPLTEIVGADAYTIPGLLPSSTLYPGASTFPKDNILVPAVDGPTLGSLAEGTKTLTALSEA